MSFHSNDSIDSYIHKMDKLLNREIKKEWRVIESVCVDEGEYLLILESNMQKIMARVLSTHAPNRMDILSPTSRKLYTINNISKQMLRFISAIELNYNEWCTLTR
ncbi:MULTISPECIES: hypothetical protein [Citrobacter freundii complex]|uniref:hypothetical protein n=2 Tax=Citrobacter freundii complex TaxID=1344959 RepID=UPI002D7FBD87|nr:hypothetical protein [Citrobacter cronae]